MLRNDRNDVYMIMKAKDRGYRKLLLSATFPIDLAEKSVPASLRSYCPFVYLNHGRAAGKFTPLPTQRALLFSTC